MHCSTIPRHRPLEELLTQDNKGDCQVPVGTYMAASEYIRNVVLVIVSCIIATPLLVDSLQGQHVLCS